MVRLNRIYTRTGDAGTTGLGTGERRLKSDLRVEAFGAVDETNAAIGIARLSVPDGDIVGPMLARIQNDLFDLGADLCIPETGASGMPEALRIVASQVKRLEKEIDAMNKALCPLKSFVLPSGTAGAAYLHLARALCRRAERAMVGLTQKPNERVGAEALRYINRLSDHLFVASRYLNREIGDILWIPGQTRPSE